MAIKMVLAAKILETTRPKLVALLQRHGKFNQDRTPTEQSIKDGYFICEIRSVNKADYQGTYPIYLVTPKGFAMIQHLLACESNEQERKQCQV